MKVGAIPENAIEWVLHKLNLVPTPLLDTLQAATLARAVMVGTKLGVFEAVAAEPLGADEIARRIGTDGRATEKLLNALVGSGYLSFKDGRYAIARVARKWLLKSGPRSLYDNMLHRFLEWKAIEQFEDFVRTGEPLRVHEGGLPLAVPMSPPRAGRSNARLRGIALNSGARAILGHEKQFDRFRSSPDGEALAGLTWLAAEAIDSCEVNDWQPVPSEPDRPAFLQYTSGTTSKPSGVVVTHANLIENSRQIAEAFAFRSDDLGLS